MFVENRRAILGLFLVLIGGLVLLENLHLIEIPYWLISWKTLLIGIGVFNLIIGNRTPGIVLTALGGLFLVRDFYYLDFRDLWPIGLIIVGLAFIFRQRNGNKVSAGHNDRYFDVLNIFGGGNQIVSSPHFEGGRITSIFGGSEVYLSEASPSGVPVIEVFTMFGGSEIIIPAEWNAKVQVTAILGAFEDKRINRSNDPDAPTVIIKGFIMFGGGEVRN
ncbi:MAG: hypothetical protein JXQ90_13400 [Cyclobacteriaceae bacterium]